MENAARVYSHGSEQWSLSNLTEESEGTQFIEEDILEPMGLFSSDNDNPLPEEPTTEGNYNLYEENCPYRRDELFKFRLIEAFSDGLVYTGDSFGDHSYIDANESRGCLAPCLCDQHNNIPEAFTFVAYKSSDQLAIAIHSRDLYLGLISTVGLEELYAEGTDQANIVNGLVLLKNYSTLKAHLNAVQSNPRALGSLVLEMSLLIDGFLADGEIFKSYGYEDLYENRFLTYDHWKEFQQAQLEKDISALEQSYYEVDNDIDFREESPMPLAKADLLGQETREVQPSDLNISNQPIAEFEFPPYLTKPLLASAIKWDEEDFIRMFLERGAQLTEKDHEAISEYIAFVSGRRPAHPSCDVWLSLLLADPGLEGIVRLVLDHGADANSSIEGFRSPLVVAASFGHEGIVRLLLDHGADANISLYSPVVDAIMCGHEGIVRLLLDHGAGANHSHDLLLGHSLLEIAVNSGHESIVRLLLDRGADATAAAFSVMRNYDYKSMIRFDQALAAAQKSRFENERRQRLQVLHKKFGEQNLKLRMATAQSTTSFRNLGKTLKDHRKAWAYGITTLRRLCKGKVHHNLAHTLAFLCLSKAISEALDKNGACENSTDFFQDLDRWQILFEADATSLDAYKEAVRLMWGIELNERVNASEKALPLETLVYFQALASALVNQTRELFTHPCNSNSKGLERSQECWRQRFSQNSSNSENNRSILGSQSSGRTSTQVFEAKNPKHPDPQYPDPQLSDPQPPDPQLPQKEYVLRERVNHDISSAGMSPVVALLMAGAIFAIVLLFLKWLRDTSSRVSYCSAVAVSLKEMESQQVDVKHAADNIFNRLQQTAPTITYTIAKLKDHLCQVLKQSRVTCFSKLKNAFAGCTSSSILGCTETEAVVIQQIVQQTCDYQEPVYALQERYRNLESYMNLRDRIIIVPSSSASSTLVAVPAGLNTPDVASTSHSIQNPVAPSPRGGRSYTSPSFCQDCQRDFRSPGNLKKHRHDKHGGARYQCRYCEKNYSRNSYKNIHEIAEH